jgi:hypothetical protein
VDSAHFRDARDEADARLFSGCLSEQLVGVGRRSGRRPNQYGFLRRPGWPEQALPVGFLFPACLYRRTTGCCLLAQLACAGAGAAACFKRSKSVKRRHSSHSSVGVEDCVDEESMLEKQCSV